MSTKTDNRTPEEREMGDRLVQQFLERNRKAADAPNALRELAKERSRNPLHDPSRNNFTTGGRRA
jgi:hypothetical protein